MKSQSEHFEDHHKEAFSDSALTVNQGIVQPPTVNPHFRRSKRRSLTLDDYMKGILCGDVSILAQAITLIESSRAEDHALAQKIIDAALPHTGNSIRIGFTGVPGAGKSTFIEAIGNRVCSLGNKLAVLAIDPSSERSKGSILGDKTRMETLVNNPSAFIRPSPSAGSLGGVARKTRETIILCEAAGYNVIFVETVGVGQSETAVHSMVDLFLLLQISGAGDELQGIKRGIMEMADLVAITKADGENLHKAGLARAQIANALQLFPMPLSGWKPKVMTTSAYEGTGLNELWGEVNDFINNAKSNGYYHDNRARQAKYWMYESIEAKLKENFYNSPTIENQLMDIETAVLEDKISSFAAAAKLLEEYYNKN